MRCSWPICQNCGVPGASQLLLCSRIGIVIGGSLYEWLLLEVAGMMATPLNVQENTETRAMYRTTPQPGSPVITSSANNMRLPALGMGIGSLIVGPAAAGQRSCQRLLSRKSLRICHIPFYGLFTICLTPLTAVNCFTSLAIKTFRRRKVERCRFKIKSEKQAQHEHYCRSRYHRQRFSHTQISTQTGEMSSARGRPQPYCSTSRGT